MFRGIALSILIIQFHLISRSLAQPLYILCQTCITGHIRLDSIILRILSLSWYTDNEKSGDDQNRSRNKYDKSQSYFCIRYPRLILIHCYFQYWCFFVAAYAKHVTFKSVYTDIDSYKQKESSVKYNSGYVQGDSRC